MYAAVRLADFSSFHWFILKIYNVFISWFYRRRRRHRSLLPHPFTLSHSNPFICNILIRVSTPPLTLYFIRWLNLHFSGPVHSTPTLNCWEPLDDYCRQPLVVFLYWVNNYECLFHVFVFNKHSQISEAPRNTDLKRLVMRTWIIGLSVKMQKYMCNFFV